MAIPRVCYFGIYPPVFARNRVYLRGLEQNGAKVVTCFDESPSVMKYLRLVQKHRAVRKKYDVLMVGYLSGVAVPLARLVSRRPLVYNALGTLYETAVHDRSFVSPRSFKAIKAWLVDWLALKLSDLVLVESEAQKKYIGKNFHIRDKKLVPVWTGADDSVFFPDASVAKRKRFTAVFRGGFLPATGVETVLEAARQLKDSGVDFLVIGRGMLEAKITAMVSKYDLDNVELVTDYLPADELRRQMLSGHVCLGQFSDHERLDRTLQNKTFEALALGLPYITRASESNRELLTDRENCLLVRPEDPESLAAAILELKNRPEKRHRLSERGHLLFQKELSPPVIGRRLLDLISSLEKGGQGAGGKARPANEA